MHSMNILSKAQIIQVQNVNQKVTLHRPYSLFEAVDDLLKYTRNSA